jgi:hypothetical protein
MKAYSLRTPAFDPVSGGIRVMYGLYGWLLAKGQIAYLNAKIPNQEFIGVYPEIYHGNDMEASTVVRYLLNKPGVMSLVENGVAHPGPTIFNKGDRIYSFSRLFCEDEDLEESHILFLPILNLHLFKDQKKTRNKTCYFVGKGISTNAHPQDAIPITRQFAVNQSALADLLNECDVMYCYDPVTAMTEVARLCGCRVVMINNNSKDEFKRYEPGLNGISWGYDEHIPLDTEGFRTHYMNLRGIFSKRLDIFIEDTQK